MKVADRQIEMPSIPVYANTTAKPYEVCCVCVCVSGVCVCVCVCVCGDGLTKT
jgi:hypothetical protein